MNGGAQIDRGSARGPGINLLISIHSAVRMRGFETSAVLYVQPFAPSSFCVEQYNITMRDVMSRLIGNPFSRPMREVHVHGWSAIHSPGQWNKNGTQLVRGNASPGNKLILFTGAMRGSHDYRCTVWISTRVCIHVLGWTIFQCGHNMSWLIGNPFSRPMRAPCPGWSAIHSPGQCGTPCPGWSAIHSPGQCGIHVLADRQSILQANAGNPCPGWSAIHSPGQCGIHVLADRQSILQANGDLVLKISLQDCYHIYSEFNTTTVTYMNFGHASLMTRSRNISIECNIRCAWILGI